MENKKKEKLKKVLPYVLIPLLLVLIIGITYAIYTFTSNAGVNSITTGLVSMSYTESSNVINIENALPIQDEDGYKQGNEYFDFSVTSNLTLNEGDPDTNVDYEITLEPITKPSGLYMVSNPTEEQINACKTFLVDDLGWWDGSYDALGDFCSGGENDWGETIQNYLDWGYFDYYTIDELVDIGIIENITNVTYSLNNNITTEAENKCKKLFIDEYGYYSDEDELGNLCNGGTSNRSYDVMYKMVSNPTTTQINACKTYLVEDLGWWNNDELGDLCSGGEDDWGETMQNILDWGDFDGYMLDELVDIGIITTTPLTILDEVEKGWYDYETILYLVNIGIIDIEGTESLSNEDIKIYLTEVEDSNAETPIIESLISDLDESTYGKNNKVLLNTKHTHTYGTNSVTKNYRLRAWIDYNVDASLWSDKVNYEYKFKVNINGGASYLYATPEYCFEYEDAYEVVDNITSEIENACKTYLIEDSGRFNNNTIGDFCSGGEDKWGETMQSLVVEGQFEGDELEELFDIGIIEKSDGVIITNFKCFVGNVDESEEIPDVVIPRTLGGNLVTSIGYNAFEPLIADYCTDACWSEYGFGISSITIPDSVTTIGSGAFSNNHLTSVTIPDSVTTIGEFAFISNQLTSVVIPNGVTIIRQQAFANNQLTSVVIPDSVTTIEHAAFHYNQLTSVTIPDSVTSLSGFENNQLTSVVIPNSVTTIGDDAFYENQLTSLVIPDSVTSIGHQAFSSNQLTSLVIPDSVTSIGYQAFSSNQLTSVVIPDSVTTIDYGAFSGNLLTSVTIPDSVTEIGSSAFYNNKLTSVVIPDSVTTIGSSAFANNNLSWVYIGSGSNLTTTTGIGSSAFSSSNRTSSSNGITYVNNPNLTIYNNSGKKFKWYYVTQGRENSTTSTYCFVTGTVPSYTSGSSTYNKVIIKTGDPR